jgi:iron complex transport system substrate-binding protein
MFIYGQEHAISAVLNDIGLQRPASQRGDFFTIDNISLENLADVDGDVIFLSYRGGKAAREVLNKLQQQPLWRQLKAVQNNQVYLVDAAH